MQGYIMLHRKILEWEWYTDTNVKVVFLHLILLANHEDKEWRGLTIKRGELVTSRENLAGQTGLTVQQIRTALKKLESTNDIVVKSTNKHTLIKIVKYALYQFDTRANNQQLTNKQPINNPQNNHQITTNNNDNKLIYSRVSDDIDLSVTENQIPYDEIIDYLNCKAGTRFKPSSSKTRTKIHARWCDGFRLNDFKEVIDVKVAEWMDTDMDKYLRPETLFGSKFEGYLNQVKKKEKDPYRSMPYV